MSRYPEYRERRTSWGIDALGGLVVEIETAGGQIGIGISHGGEAGCFIVERHSAPLPDRLRPARRRAALGPDVALAPSTTGARGWRICAISAVDLALWDLCGKLRDEPVYKLLGGETKESVPCYVTGPKPARYQELGFFGGKLPLPHGPADGRDGSERQRRAGRARRGKRSGPTST